MMRLASLWVAGLLMLASAAAHSVLGWRGMSQALASIQAPSDLTSGLATGWRWGSVAMVAFGLIVLLGAVRLRRGDTSLNTPVLIIAAFYFMFGVGAIVALGEAFFLLFVAKGLLPGVPVALPMPAARR